MKWQCVCNFQNPSRERTCLACARTCPPADGFLNVVLAEAQEERETLCNLYAKAIGDAEQRGALESVRAFEDAINMNSRTVISCYFERFSKFKKRLNHVFPCFQVMLESGLIWESEDSENGDITWEERENAEKSTLPGCWPNIHFGNLSIEDTGIPHYGNYVLIWKADMVDHRTSLFIGNCVTWRRENKIPADAAAPLGMRANWQDRHLLAVVKCADRITKDTGAADFPAVLLQPGADNGKDDVFIEAHIWGRLTRWSLAKVICIEPEISPTLLDEAQEIARDLKVDGVEVQGI